MILDINGCTSGFFIASDGARGCVFVLTNAVVIDNEVPGKSSLVLFAIGLNSESW